MPVTKRGYLQVQKILWTKIFDERAMRDDYDIFLSELVSVFRDILVVVHNEKIIWFSKGNAS